MLVHSPYEQIHEFSFKLNGEKVTTITKPGIPNWDRVSPSTSLLAENIKIAGRSRALLVGCGPGALAVALSRENPDCEIWLLDHQYIALDLAAQTMSANDISDVKYIHDPTTLHTFADKFDLIAIELPKGRRLAQRLLAESYPALATGGQLYLAGANTQGIKSIARDVDALFGQGTILGYKKGHRVVRWVKNDPEPQSPPWLQLPGAAPGAWIEFNAVVRGLHFNIFSLPGVFSSDQLDAGTELLLSRLQVRSSDRVLDLGCGYGLIGIFAAHLGAGQVDLVDSNLLAISAARKNIAAHRPANTQAIPSDILQAVRGEKYTLIVTNPPFHNGKEVDYQITLAFIQQSASALEPGGQFLLVANRFIPYEKMIAQYFNKTERLAETGKFYVISATK